MCAGDVGSDGRDLPGDGDPVCKQEFNTLPVTLHPLQWMFLNDDEY